MLNSGLKLWDPDGGSLDFGCWALWKPEINLPGTSDKDQWGDTVRSVPTEELRAMGHPSTARLVFYAGHLQKLTTDELSNLYEWFDEYIRAKQSVLTVYIRSAYGDETLAPHGRIRFCQVQAVTYPGWLEGMLTEIPALAAPETALGIDFIVSAWGNVADYNVEPDYNDETPSNCTVLWRRPA
ncbi:hypothetical protein IT575_12210 [bacterium]|nr:hypothetical protein [bacterium]